MNRVTSPRRPGPGTLLRFLDRDHGGPVPSGATAARRPRLTPFEGLRSPPTDRGRVSESLAVAPFAAGGGAPVPIRVIIAACHHGRPEPAVPGLRVAGRPSFRAAASCRRMQSTGSPSGRAAGDSRGRSGRTAARGPASRTRMGRRGRVARAGTEVIPGGPRDPSRSSAAGLNRASAAAPAARAAVGGMKGLGRRSQSAAGREQGIRGMGRMGNRGTTRTRQGVGERVGGGGRICVRASAGLEGGSGEQRRAE